jgi:antirestriction protein ArdC
MKKTKKIRRDLYQEITDTVIASLEQGNIPWERPWGADGAGLRDAPRSVSTGKTYSGTNWFWLEMMRQAKGYSSQWWLTFNQAKKLGGMVKKGERGTVAVFWKLLSKDEIDPATGEKAVSSFPVLRSFVVFNVDQCDMPAEALAKLGNRLDKLAPVIDAGDVTEIEPIAIADAALMGFIADQKIGFANGGDQAYYSPSDDRVQMPPVQSFKDSESYYATLAHEAVHSTGHKSRLARAFEKQAAFGSADYSREELVAELGASMVLAVLGIDKPAIATNRDAYIQSWIKKLQSDPKAIVLASGKAAKAADYILDIDAAGDQAPKATV